MTRFSLGSLRVRLVLLVLFALVPAFALVMYGDSEERRLATREAQDNALGVAHLVSNNQAQLIEAAHQLLVALAQLPELRSHDSTACSPLIANLLEQYPVYANLGAADLDGNVFCSGVPFQGQVNIADRSYFRQSLQTRDFAIGEYQIGRITGVASLNAGVPILDETGNAQAVVFAALNLSWINQLASEAQLLPGSVLAVTDRNHTILAHYPDSAKWVGQSMEGSPLAKAIDAQQGDGTAETTGFDQVARLYAFVPLRDAASPPDVYVSVGVPRAVAYAEVNNAFARNMVGLGLVAALAFAVAWFFGDRFIVRRANALSKVTEELTAGNLSARTGESYGAGELSELARRFDEMAATLQQRDAERAESEAALRKWAVIFQSTQVGFVVDDSNGRLTGLINPAFAAMHGYTIEELKSKSAQDLIAPEERANNVEQQRILSDQGHHIFETKHVRKDGTVFPVLVDATCVKDEQGNILHCFSSVQDISQLRRAEEAERDQRVLTEALHDTAAILNSTLDFDEVLDRVLDNVGRVVPHESANIMLVEAGIARAVGSRGYAERGLEEWLTRQRFLVAQHPRMQKMIETRQPHLITDTRESSEWIDLAQTRWIRSVAGMPIRVKDRVIGFLNLDSSTPGFFTQTHLARLETFADQVAIALENARLLAETEQRANQFGELYELAHDLATQRNLPALLQTLLNRATVLLGAPCGFIYLYDAGRKDLELAIEKGFNAPIGTRLKMGEGMAGRVAQDRQPLLVDDYRTWENRAAVYQGAQYTAVVEVPMVYGGELVGVLGVAHINTTSQHFTNADADLLTLLAGQAASMVRNARLLVETERRASEFAALYEITLDLAAHQDLPMLLQTIVDRAVQLLSTSGGGMYLYDAARGDLSVTVATHSSTPIGTRLQLGEGMAGRVAQMRQPLIVDDYRNWPGRSAQFAETPLTAVLEVPMLYGGELIGVLVVEEVGETTYRFTEEDARLLSLFAAHAAGAVHNARLLQETNSRAEQLGLLYDVGLTLNSVLDPRVQLEFLFKIATKALNAERAEFFRFDPALKQLGIELSVGYSDEKAKEVSRLSFSAEDERGLIGWVAQHRLPLCLGDVQADPRWILVDPEIRSGLWVPIQHENQLLGVLGALSTRLNAFTAQDERLLVLFGNQVATAMENARLFEAQRQRGAELEALRQASLGVTSTLDLSRVLEQILEHALKLVSANNAHIFLYDGARVTFSAAMWADGRQRAAFSEPRENGITYNVARSGVRIVVPDTRDHPLFEGESWSGAILGLPLKVGERVRGVMNIAFAQPHNFDENELRVLELLADQAAVALENARLFDETQSSLAITARLYELSGRILNATTLEQTAELLTLALRDAFDADGCVIQLLDAYGQPEFRNGVAKPPLVYRKLDPRPEGLVKRVWKTGEPIVLNDPALMHPHAREQGIQSIIGLPLRSESGNLGVLIIQYCRQHNFTEHEIDLLSLFANQAALAINRVRLLDETRRRADRLAILNRVASAVSQTMNLDELMEVIYQEISIAFKVDAFFVALYDEPNQELDYRIQVDQGVREPPRRRSLAAGLAAQVIKTQRPLRILDWEKEKDRLPQPVLWGSLKLPQSWLGVPIRTSHAVLGIISVEAYVSNAYGEEEEYLLTTIADQVAVVIQNVRLFEETRRRLVELEAVNRISVALRLAQTVDEIVPRVLEEALTTLDMQAGQVAFYDPATDELRVAAARGWFARTPKAAKANDGIAGLVFESGQPYVTSAFKPDPKTSDLARAQIPAGWGGAIVPIRTGQIVTGVFGVSVPLPRQITETEVRLLSLIAEITGNAIHRAALHDQTQQRLQRLDALHVIDTAIGASLDLRVVLNVLLDQVTTQLRVDAADVLLLDPHTQMLEYAAGRGFRTSAIERTRMRMGQGYAGRAAMERRVVQISDLTEAGAAKKGEGSMEGEDFVAYYAVPLIAKGQVKGVLEFFHRTGLEPDAEWRDFAETLAGQAAIAIDNATLFDGLQRSNFEISLAYDATIDGWARTLELRERSNAGHTERVTDLTLRLARAMEINNSKLIHIRRGALLHDIGKMGLSDRVIQGRDGFTEEEEEILRAHPSHAYEILAPISYLQPAIEIPYCHHERWDGTGYPRGLKGNQIPLAARIFAIADAWDELRTDRPDRAALSEEEAQRYLIEQSGKQFDPAIVTVFLNLISEESP